MCTGAISSEPRSAEGLLARCLGLISVALGGTAVYAASFRFAAGGEALSDTAWRIGASAAAAWIVFGLLLFAIGRSATADAWIDLCLSMMALGIVVMSTGTLYNVCSHALFWPLREASALPGVHFAVLAAADVSMGAWFVARAIRKGMSAGLAIAAWALGLNAPFALLMFAWR